MLNEVLDTLGHILPWLLLTAYFRPLVEIVLLILGEWWFHTRFEEDRTKFNRYIIQITTVGREVERVKEIIDEIKSYPMSMDYQIWVVLEPGNPVDYPHADRVIVVPKEFVAVSQYKCRALEYTRTVRAKLGYGGYDTKITFLDDDTSPTWEYLETAYAGDYDICQGLTAPRVEYGSGPFTHYLLSHIDDLRFHNCMTYCSSFQGIFNSPLFVHGEGLTITGSTEQQVGWNFRIFASEDLTFGCNAANQGLRWGWFHEYIELTSPWTWGAYFKQRRRWMWGNIHAIVNRDVLPFWPAVRVATRYVLSLFTFIGSAVAIILIHYGQDPYLGDLVPGLLVLAGHLGAQLRDERLGQRRPARRWPVQPGLLGQPGLPDLLRGHPGAVLGRLHGDRADHHALHGQPEGVRGHRQDRKDLRYRGLHGGRHC